MSNDKEVEFRSSLAGEVAGFGIPELTEHQKASLVKHYAMVCRWNRQINLTRIVAPRDAARLHYAESLFGARFITHERTVLDIGSGAGFPAIPIAVVKPYLQVTALEANQRKSLFLKEAIEALELKNVKVVNIRLEEFDWPPYELLTSRALDRASSIFPKLIASLSANQRLMLFSTNESVFKLAEQAGDTYSVARYPIPQSEARVIVIFTRR